VSKAKEALGQAKKDDVATADDTMLVNDNTLKTETVRLQAKQAAILLRFALLLSISIREHECPSYACRSDS